MQPRPPSPTTLIARIRWLMARHHRAVKATVVLVVISFTGAQWRATHSLDAARRSWGSVQSVWVADTDIAAGQPLAAHRRTLPTPAVPPSAIRTLPPTARATHPIARGEVIVVSDATNGSATIPTDWVVFTIATDSLPTLVAGDRVALYGSGSLLCDGVATSTRPPSNQAAQPSAEIGVPRSCAAAVGDQLATHSVQVGALSPAG
jgi:hypothetical protein